MWFFVVLCFVHGVCVEPPDPAEQQRVMDELLLKEWGTPAQPSTCQSNLFSTCAPVTYGI